MNRIKLALATAFVVLTISIGQANAQEKRIAFGLKVGEDLSTFTGDLKDTKYTFKYQAGITIDIALTENIYILTGMDFHMKGTNSKSEPSIKYNPLYLQTPAHIAYKFKLSPSAKFVINAGPYAAYGIGGKVKEGNESLKIFGDNRLTRLDYGVGGGIGFELSIFCINAGYDFGLKNISDIKDCKINNQNAYLTVGIKF